MKSSHFKLYSMSLPLGSRLPFVSVSVWWSGMNPGGQKSTQIQKHTFRSTQIQKQCSDAVTPGLREQHRRWWCWESANERTSLEIKGDLIYQIRQMWRSWLRAWLPLIHLNIFYLVLLLFFIHFIHFLYFKKFRWCFCQSDNERSQNIFY